MATPGDGGIEGDFSSRGEMDFEFANRFRGVGSEAAWRQVMSLGLKTFDFSDVVYPGTCRAAPVLSLWNEFSDLTQGASPKAEEARAAACWCGVDGRAACRTKRQIALAAAISCLYISREGAGQKAEGAR